MKKLVDLILIFVEKLMLEGFELVFIRFFEPFYVIVFTS